MKDYTAKTLQEAIELACLDQKVEEKDLIYEVKEEKKGLFKKTATISVYELADAISFGENYIKKILESINIEGTVKTQYKDELIKFILNTNHNSILIGKNGNGLKALTDLTRLAISVKFKRRYKMIIDINEYKNNKYKRIISLAKRTAREVLTSKNSVKLDPMTSDERRVIHKALAKFAHIETQSEGEGNLRAIVIKYVD